MSCSICNYISIEMCITECGHSFHTSCLWNYLKNKVYECPTCRARLYINKDHMIDCLANCNYPIKIPFRDDYRRGLKAAIIERKKLPNLDKDYHQQYVPDYAPPRPPIFLTHSGLPNIPVLHTDRKTGKTDWIYCGPN